MTTGKPIPPGANAEAPEAQQLSSAQLRASLENTPNVAVQWYDEDGRICYWNPASEALYGWQAAEVIGRSLDGLILSAEDGARFRKIITTVRETGRPSPPYEIAIRRRDGTQGWVLATTFGIPMADDRAGFVCMDVDITERRQAEEALRESELRLRSLSDNLPGGLVYQIDSGMDGRERRFTYFSAGIEPMHGITAAAAMADAMAIYGQVVEEDRQMVAAREEEARVRMVPFSAEVRVRLPSGETRWRLFTSAPRRLPAGRLVWDGIELDITERMRAEAEREQLQAQLLQVQKMESVGRLAGGVAHDFNNMLSVIIGHADMALARVDPTGPLHADLEEIRKAAARSADLTRQLLAFARKQTAAPKVLDLNETVEGMLKMLRRLIGEGIDLVWQPGAGLWAIRVDPSQIDQILANLCVNARDAIAGFGTVAIRTENRILDEAYCAGHPGALPGEYAVLTVSDTGCGMDRETMASIFEPFFTTKELGKGTGLGLATVYGIVKQNSGFIGVWSEPGQGTTFQVCLPRHVSPAERRAEKAPVVPTVRGHETILLVEDEPAILDLTASMLEHLGFTVLAAIRPGEAIRLAERHPGPIDLLMTDVVMPEMNGRDLARNLLQLYPGIRRLFMSGYSADVIALHGVLDEGIHFLQKPFSLQELAARVREALAAE